MGNNNARDAVNGRSRVGSFIDVFAGCGGLSLGLMEAGWRGIFAVEKEANAFATLRANLVDGPEPFRFAWPKWLPVEPLDISRLTEEYKRELRTLRGKTDLLVGGPPCQGFSSAGKRNKNDPRNRLFKHYLRIVELVQPTFLLIENVRGISIEFGKMDRGRARKRGRPHEPFSRRIRRGLAARGYTTYPALLKASDFGVPQRRQR